MSDIEVIERREMTQQYFVLEHPFDVSLLELGQLEGPYLSRVEAEQAAELLLAAITGSDD
jgi:hypothetical protein